MINIVFVCHGNICRSPMAEFIMQDLVQKAGRGEQFLICSAATSTEEIGHDLHPSAKEKLMEQQIPFAPRHAVQLQHSDLDRYDYFIGMDSHNIANMQRILGASCSSKIYRLLDFTNAPADIADPWYTGDFDLTYREIVAGCSALLQQLTEPGDGKEC